MQATGVLTISAGLPILQQLDAGGTGALIEGPVWGEEAEVGASSVALGTGAVHCNTETSYLRQCHNSCRTHLEIMSRASEAV